MTVTPSIYTTFPTFSRRRRRTRDGGGSVVISASIQTELGQWLAAQSVSEKQTVSALVCRAILFERDRVAQATYGLAPGTVIDLDYPMV